MRAWRRRKHQERQHVKDRPCPEADNIVAASGRSAAGIKEASARQGAISEELDFSQRLAGLEWRVKALEDEKPRQWSPWQQELFEEEEEEEEEQLQQQLRQKQQHQPPPHLQHDSLEEGLSAALEAATQDVDVPFDLEDNPPARFYPAPTDSSPGSGSTSRKNSRGSSAPTLSAITEDGPLRSLVARTARLEDDLTRLWRFLDMRTEQFQVALQQEAGFNQLRQHYSLRPTDDNLLEETAALCSSLRNCVGALNERCSSLEEHVWPERPCNHERRPSTGPRNLTPSINSTGEAPPVHPPPDVASQGLVGMSAWARRLNPPAAHPGRWLHKDDERSFSPSSASSSALLAWEEPLPAFPPPAPVLPEAFLSPRFSQSEEVLEPPTYYPWVKLRTSI